MASKTKSQWGDATKGKFYAGKTGESKWVNDLNWRAACDKEFDYLQARNKKRLTTYTPDVDTLGRAVESLLSPDAKPRQYKVASTGTPSVADSTEEDAAKLEEVRKMLSSSASRRSALRSRGSASIASFDRPATSMSRMSRSSLRSSRSRSAASLGGRTPVHFIDDNRSVTSLSSVRSKDILEDALATKRELSSLKKTMEKEAKAREKAERKLEEIAKTLATIAEGGGIAAKRSKRRPPNYWSKKPLFPPPVPKDKMIVERKGDVVLMHGGRRHFQAEPRNKTPIIAQPNRRVQTPAQLDRHRLKNRRWPQLTSL